MRLLRKPVSVTAAPGSSGEPVATHVRGELAGSGVPTSSHSSPDGVGAQRESGRYATALRIINSELASGPNTPALLMARVTTLNEWGRFREACDAASGFEVAGDPSPAFDMMLGWSWFNVGNMDEAEAQMRKAVAADPQASATQANLAVVLQAKGRLVEAAECYGRALELNGDDAQALINLAVCRLDLQDLEAGEALVRRAIALDGNRARAWANLGVALALQNRHDEALDAFECADRLEAKTGVDVDNFVNFALYLREGGRTSDAISIYEKYLPLRPSVTGHNDYAYALLSSGRLAEGWNQYEFRWMRPPLLPLRAGFNRPAWAGQKLGGKVILLRAEQGFGDIIQFLRYAPLVKAQGARVLLQVREGLERLAQGFDGVDQVLDRSMPLPNFDFYINLPSLPRAFGTDLESIPANVPYLRANPADATAGMAKLADRQRIRVGIAWAGSPTHLKDRFRSMKLSMMAPLLGVEGVRFVSLQKGAAAAEATGALLEGVDWVDISQELADFSDTAAVVNQLDLVICVDTAVAHLAGALGKPVWVMLPQPADFRWLEGRDDSPWYPTMRLFRQSRRDDWSDVVARVTTALEERVRAGPAAALLDRVLAPMTTPVVLPLAIPASLKVGHRPGMSAVAETAVGILQYLPDEPFVGDAIGWYGEYLQPQLELLARLVRPGMTLMEVGAGIGAHAVFLGALLGEAGHLFLYESQPLRQQILRQNLAVNGLSPVTVMRRTLGNRGEADSAANGTSPTAETLDELQLERLDWLKVNASGAARDVLAGASDTLWRLRPLLFLAAADEPTLQELVERAREFGYRCWRVETTLFNPRNFNRRETDIFDGAKTLALLAIPEEIDVDVALDECIEIS